MLGTDIVTQKRVFKTTYAFFSYKDEKHTKHVQQATPPVQTRAAKENNGGSDV